MIRQEDFELALEESSRKVKKKKKAQNDLFLEAGKRVTLA
ncbi:unnamed protein product [Toxocara canis]|uniref:Uncharacterized protein n=1 Tax=Toxocara canis TaxID=6265 RepID=A0A3P7ITP4_TOXCA|nr:unnamed protein product [Toxocara canis]